MLGARHLAASAAVLALAATACAQAVTQTKSAPGPLTSTPDGRALQLTFADEFDSFRRFQDGKGVWRTTFRDGRDDKGDDFNLRTLKWNKEVQLYVDPDMRGHHGRHGDDEPAAQRVADDKPLGLNPFRISDGKLEIRFDKAPAALAQSLGGFQYTSGLITTQPSFAQAYGYFEMRARLPRGKGVWPAFWLLPADLSWPPEIDVMESVGDPSKVYAVYHSNRAKIEGREFAVSPDDFHVYAVSWDKDQIAWFIDGREVRREKTPADMHKPMYMLANIASGGDWAGSPDASTPLPATLTIDYIRAYRFAQ
jgi:beta-glucanase (GH16 family)